MFQVPTKKQMSLFLFALKMILEKRTPTLNSEQKSKNIFLRMKNIFVRRRCCLVIIRSDFFSSYKGRAAMVHIRKDRGLTR